MQRGHGALGALLWAAGCAVLVSGAACAESEEPLRRVDFGVERTRDVANDWVRAIVGVSAEDADPAALADRVNRDMRWGLEQARAVKGVEVQSGGYHTSPVHHEGKLRRWRSSQDLILEAADVSVLSGLLGRLQERLQLRSIAFTVSPERRRAVEDELIQEALAAFRARADLVRQSLQASGYELVRASINAGGGQPPRPLYAESMMRAQAAAVAPPAFEGGSSTLTVNVQGTIELR